MAWRVRSATVVGNAVRVVVEDGRSGNTQTVQAALPGAGGKEGESPASQPSSKAADNQTATASGESSDRVESALANVTTRTAAGLDPNNEFRRKQAAAERVKRALLTGQLPNQADLSLAGWNSTAEAVAANTVNGVSPTQLVEKVRQVNLARQVPKDRQITSFPDAPASDPKDELLSKAEALKQLDDEIEAGAAASQGTFATSTDKMGNLYNARNAAWKARTRLDQTPGEFISRRKLDQIRRDAGLDAAREATASTAESRSGMEGKKLVGIKAAGMVGQNIPGAGEKWSETLPKSDAQEWSDASPGDRAAKIQQEIEKLQRELQQTTEPAERSRLETRIAALRQSRLSAMASGLVG